MSFDSLPVIIVTAKTKTAADELITELIDEDATDAVKPEGHESTDRVWRLVNKYYTALVRLHARSHGDAPRAHSGPVEAHLVHLAPDEMECGVAERLLEAAAWEGRAPAALNVVACCGAALPPALAALCARRRLEPVALQDPSEGLAAARQALHAHPWPGLRRHAAPAPPEGLQEEGDEGVEAAERFAAALSALGGGAAHARSLEGAERREAAERLVAAFAAAIGHPLRDLDL